MDPLGWALVVGLAVLAFVLGEVIGPINAVIAALLLGILAGNGLSVSDRTDGVSTFMLKRVLKFAIILLGAGIDASLLALVNLRSLGVILIVIVLGIVVSRLVGPRLGLSPDTSMLIGIGTAICGASAIAAVAPILRSKQEEIGLALGTIFAFNAAAMLTYPLLAHAFSLDPVLFGSWAGVGVHDTASAVATGFAYTAESGEAATLIKLTRTLFLIPLVVVLAVWVSRSDTDDTSLGKRITKSFPLFVLGFVAMAAANTLGLLGNVGSWISETGKLLVIGVVVAIGLSLKFAKIRALGPGLALTGLAAALVVSVASFAYIFNLM
ncbi:MAG: putative sulfate exporter family transporter [Chloroflexota bacterium]